MTTTPLKLLSSMATREMIAELLVRYERDTSYPVRGEAAGGVDVARRVQAGEAADVVVLAGTAIDKLIGDGKLMAGSRVDLVRSGIAVAVAADATAPDVSNEEGVRRAVQAARTVSYSTGPSGVYLESLFERWGLLGSIRERIVVPPPGIAVASLVASGAVELGFQQLSELLNVAHVQVVGPLPPAIQHVTIFSAAVAAASARPQDARALIEFMASPAMSALKRRHGMEPA